LALEKGEEDEKEDEMSSPVHFSCGVHSGLFILKFSLDESFLHKLLQETYSNSWAG
jgi:hypothetical protein